MPYRFRTPTTTGPWRDTRREAEEDAVRAGVASRSEAGNLCTDLWCEIEEGEGD